MTNQSLLKAIVLLSFLPFSLGSRAQSTSLEQTKAIAAEAREAYNRNPTPENERRLASADADLAADSASADIVYDTTLSSAIRAGVGNSYLDLIATVGKPDEMTIDPNTGSGLLFYSHNPRKLLADASINRVQVVSSDLCNVTVENFLVAKVSCLSEPSKP